MTFIKIIFTIIFPPFIIFWYIDERSKKKKEAERVTSISYVEEEPLPEWVTKPMTLKDFIWGVIGWGLVAIMIFGG